MKDKIRTIIQKKCSNCKEEFRCYNSGESCWCNNYKLSTEFLDNLKGNYTDCLCEKCIKQLSKYSKNK
ncbi:MAG: hypothetical protein COB15_08515 [Flavobacteriales bacterium]|nr:MAG: hypothetical protein COB15_08515 [Flavobacteriales bacterium]